MALAARGHHVTVVMKSRGMPPTEDQRELDEHSSTCSPAGSAVVQAVSARGVGPIGGEARYTFGVSRLLVRHRSDVDFVVSRHVAGGAFASRLGIPTVLDLHSDPSATAIERMAMGSFLRRVGQVGVSFNTSALAEHCAKQFPQLDSLPQVVAPNGSRPIETRDKRSHSIGYVGSVQRGKGVELVLDLATRLSDHEFHIAGGDRETLERIGSCPANVVTHGRLSHDEARALISQLEIALLPSEAVQIGPRGGSDYGSWTSPMKLFEYMAARCVVVASALPALREVLVDGSNAVLAPSGDVESWQRAIAHLTTDRDYRVRLADRAFQDWSDRYRWDHRAEAIMTLAGRVCRGEP